MYKETIHLINLYCDSLMPGFSGEHWTNAVRVLRELSRYVDLETRMMLGDLMAEMYAFPSTKLIAETRKKAIKGLKKG